MNLLKSITEAIICHTSSYIRLLPFIIVMLFSVPGFISVGHSEDFNHPVSVNCPPRKNVGSATQSREGEKMCYPAEEEVVKRALCLYVLVFRGEFESVIQDIPEPTIKKLHINLIKDLNIFIKSHDLARFQSRNEKISLKKTPGTWSKREIIDASWRTESLGVILWALSLIDRIPHYDKGFEQKRVLSKVNPKELKKFYSLAKLRKRDQIDREHDRAELWHWRHRTTQIMRDGIKPRVGMTFEQILKVASAQAVKKGTIPSSMEDDFSLFGKAYKNLNDEEYQHAGSIAKERHFVLNWLSGYSPDWDETPTDT